MKFITYEELAAKGYRENNVVKDALTGEVHTLRSVSHTSDNGYGYSLEHKKVVLYNSITGEFAEVLEEGFDKQADLDKELEVFCSRWQASPYRTPQEMLRAEYKVER